MEALDAIQTLNYEFISESTFRSPTDKWHCKSHAAAYKALYWHLEMYVKSKCTTRGTSKETEKQLIYSAL